MKCPRCAGFMRQDHFFDLEDEAGGCWFVGWHCVICGEVLDPVIAKHRRAPPVPMVDRARLPLKMTPMTPM